MSKAKTIRVYDYINHPYEAVREKLSAEALEVFRNATKIAALRAKSVASELHVNFAGIEVGTDISIFIKSIEEQPKNLTTPPVTRIQLEWEAANLPRLFPFMQAELSVYPLTATETQLDLSGNYEPPLGVLGSVIDSVLGHRIAEAAVHQFIKDIAVYLRAELTKPK
ncbi:MAG TPA: hypothetical protein VNB22_09510 [Pyrinomonadaceae bacterium]|nr:hypothetical protein [Pyrinomonadaceae bacterium]